MDTLAQADIFFFITTIAVAVTGLVFTIVLLYAIGIVRDIRAIIGIVRKETEAISDDIDEVRKSLKSHGPFISMIIAALGKVISATISAKKSKRSNSKRKSKSKKRSKK